VSVVSLEIDELLTMLYLGEVNKKVLYVSGWRKVFATIDFPYIVLQPTTLQFSLWWLFVSFKNLYMCGRKFWIRTIPLSSYALTTNMLDLDFISPYSVLSFTFFTCVPFHSPPFLISSKQWMSRSNLVCTIP